MSATDGHSGVNNVIRRDCFGNHTVRLRVLHPVRIFCVMEHGCRVLFPGLEKVELDWQRSLRFDY